jgi:hypothetical protein
MSEYQYTGKCSVCLIYGCASCRTHTYIIARCKNFLQCRTIIFPCEVNFKIISASIPYRTNSPERPEKGF